MNNSWELLAPAGDYECFQFALDFGADAVYLGAKDFGMRTSPDNFTDEQIFAAAKEAHQRGKKLYLTLNTLPTNQDIDALPDFLQRIKNLGIDALIVADLGVLSLVKKFLPEMEIHLSTQTGIMNYASATAAYELGASRVVLARELSLEDIAIIRENTPPELEIEVFVHGAMCMSVSGRCLLSNYLTGRDANRGQCTQSCRWKYSLLEETRPGMQFQISEDEHGSYIMNADDLCAAPFLDKVLKAGAISLKIEGRGKGFYYVASVTAAYRAALDQAIAAQEGEYTYPEFTQEELLRTSHRPYSPGFFFGREGATQSPRQSGYIREWQVVGVVAEQKEGKIYCVQRGKFILGETLEALLPGGKVVQLKPDQIWNEDGDLIESTPHTKMVFAIPVPKEIEFPVRTILRRRTTL